MKISKIEYENFRNFRERGSIDFPTDDTISIIYGMNGTGKTTLHQLFQWVFYGETHFNTSSSNVLYNEPYEHELCHGDIFSIFGSIHFEHPNEEGETEYYKLTRIWTYTRGLSKGKSRQKSKVLCLQKLNENKDWKPISVDNEAEKVINKILPHGLAPYFFFDGERMIVDLQKKSKDSAKDLKKALFALFDLDIYKLALEHIGTTESTSVTVLGNLFAKQSDNVDSEEITKCGEKIDNIKTLIFNTENFISKLEGEINNT